MLNKIIISLLLCISVLGSGFSQASCDGLGQNPATAFPVCGTDVFMIDTVPVCGGRNVPNPAQCTAVQFNDKNPYWYKFTCFTSGTLGFLITPNNLGDDYDWQIFDVTGRQPDEVYTDPTLFVSCNWSGYKGVTGTAPNAVNTTECDSNVPIFSKMPSLVAGHQYLLLISHFEDGSQSGYSLSFAGGTASITDPLDPALGGARAICDGRRMSVRFNKKMKCSSLAANGSDFSFSAASVTVTGAVGEGCSAGFDMDSITLSLSAPLPPGNYTITIKTGTDGNTLLDNCTREIPDAQSVPVVVYPLLPTPMDSLTKLTCSPDVLELVFGTLMDCNSIAADGSDFTLTGPAGVTILSAGGVCDEKNLSKVIRVKLSAPIQTGGNFRLTLKAGSDGNTILSECGLQTPAGSAIDFIAYDTVSAAFASIIRLGCVADTIHYTHDGKNGVNSWTWKFDNNISSNSRDTVITWQILGQKQATLIVSNGVCSDTATAEVILDNELQADFEGTAIVCPGDPATFKNNSVGDILSWSWTFGNGITSSQPTPEAQFYPSINVIRDILVQLIIKNLAGCADTATRIIRVVGNCYIAIPKGFSPNNDGLNDYLYPTNAYKARDLLFRVYNRGGQLIFETRDWTSKWDGTFKGSPQDPGTYVWILTYTNIDTGKRIELKGSTVLIR